MTGYSSALTVAAGLLLAAAVLAVTVLRGRIVAERDEIKPATVGRRAV